MKKSGMIICALMLTASVWAGEGDQYVNINSGFLFNSTLNVTAGYERQLEYGDAVELFGEVGDR